MTDAAARRALVSPATYREFRSADCDQPVHRRFEEQVARAPDAVAVALSARDVSYATLNAAANRAARTLGAALGSDDRPVGLLLDQGLDSIVWTLAVLKSGRAFVPLDQRLPGTVLAAMIADLEPAGLVAGARYRRLAETLARSQYPILGPDAAASAEGDPAMSGNLPGDIAPDAVAVVFYTSGSTGAPKGVADVHRNLLHNIRRYTNTLRFGPGDRLSMVQNPSFSGTMSSLFGALLNGATIAPCDLEDTGLPGLSDWVRGMNVTVFHSVPSIFRQLTDPVGRFPSVRVVRVEGDRASALDACHFQANFGDRCTLVNGLGATECGLVRQFFVGGSSQVAPGEALPIGYAVPDTAVRVVDADGCELPPASIGEIVVESRYLAKGYWRKPELTAQRFESLSDGVRRYRTGDLGRMDADGCLTHLGRADHQLRIAGRFVDADAIERLLLGVSGVAQAVVGDFVGAAGESRLCAWLVRIPGNDTSVESLRSALATHAGAQGLPMRFVFLEALPLSRDRKVDRTQLPRPGRERPELRNAYAAPATDLERQLAAVWCEVLELDSVGATDAFLDLGGDSLSAARVAGRLAEVLGARIRTATLFEHPTIRALAQALAPAQYAAVPPSWQSASQSPGLGSTGAPPGHRIAVIGMAGRFPGADDVDVFWSNLRAGRESITFFSADELDTAGVAAPGAMLVAARGVLSDVVGFDAPLFGLTPRQAQVLDPQQRLWLESAYRAMEDAGLAVGGAALGRPGPSVGVFTGCRESTYLWQQIGGDRAAVEALLGGIGDDARDLLLGNDRDTLATRTSYLLGFTGPSLGVQTACSTSLVAIAQACEALAGGSCDIAVAGGVTVTFPQRRGHGFVAGGIQSRDGHCRAFDADASGTVFSDGVGAVVLRRLDDALAAGDRIEAVIRGWAVNNDGSGKASFTAPSVAGQEAVIVRAQAHAGVDPREISYVEAHGTGTPVGDPMEFAALARAFRRGTDAIGFCSLGSVKTNIGHLDSAAGVAGFIKTVLALKHREIPATLHYRRPNPEIELVGSPFRVADHLVPWLAGGGRRIAGVTSLGVGGTNCHVIVEEAPVPRGEQADAGVLPASLVTLSAASAAALNAMETSFEAYVAGTSAAGLTRIASTTQRSRSQHAFRSAVVVASLDDLRSALSARPAVAPGPPSPMATRPARQSRRALYLRGKARHASRPPMAFVFTGQGSQVPGMGRALYAACPAFRRLLERCDHVLRGHLDRSLLEIMFDARGAPVERTDYAQPLLFALEVSLAQLLRGWGIEPRWVIGHSLGEYAAACVAGVFDVDDGLRLAAARGRLMQDLPGEGRMLATMLVPGALREFLAPFGDAVSIAAINSPTQTVLAGEAWALERLAREFLARDIACRALPVAHAFHSAQMSAVQQPLERLAGAITLHPPTVRLASNLHGSIVTDEVTRPAYWATHARETVRFAAGIEALIDDGCRLFLEIGPDSVLAPLVRENAGDRGVDVIATLRRGDDDWRAMLEALARLFVNGVEVDWPAFQQGPLLPPVRLPPYPFQRTPHWYQGDLAGNRGSRPVTTGIAEFDRPGPRVDRRDADGVGEADHPLLGRRLHLPGSDEVRFATTFSQTNPQFLDDHRLFGVSLPPGASHFAMLAQAALQIEFPKGDAGGQTEGDRGGAPDAAADAHFRFERVHLLRPLLLPDGCERDVQLICRRGRGGAGFEIVSADARADQRDALAWTSHLTAWGRAEDVKTTPEGPAGGGRPWDLQRVRERCGTRSTGAEFYSRIWANQGGTGSAFRWIESIWQGEREALCRAVCPSTIGDAHRYRLHPGLIEAACQVLHACSTIETRESIAGGGVTWVPFSVAAFGIFAPRANHQEAWCHASLRVASGDYVEADLTILAASGDVVARLEGFCLRRITREAVTGNDHGDPTRLPTTFRLAVESRDPAGGPARPAAATLDPTVITDYLRRQCAALSGHPVTDIAPDAGFIELGLDSIAAVSLANDIAREFGRMVPVVRILSCDRLVALAVEICEGSRREPASIASTARAIPG